MKKTGRNYLRIVLISVAVIVLGFGAIRILADIFYYDALFKVEEINAKPVDLPDASLYATRFTAEQMNTQFRYRLLGDRPSSFNLKKFKAKYPDPTSAVYQTSLGSDVFLEIFIQVIPPEGTFGIKYRR